METSDDLNEAARRAIEQECARLITAFAYLVDHRRYDELIALFVDDCRFERPGVVVVGKSELRAFLNNRPTTTITRHVCSQPFFEKADLREARAMTYMMMYHAPGDADTVGEISGPAAIVELHDLFRFTPTGWRIVERVNHLVLIPRH